LNNADSCIFFTTECVNYTKETHLGLEQIAELAKLALVTLKLNTNVSKSLSKVLLICIYYDDLLSGQSYSELFNSGESISSN
jgi:hypothetical protein